VARPVGKDFAFFVGVTKLLARWALIGTAAVLISIAGLGHAKLAPTSAATAPKAAIPGGGSWTTYHHDNAHSGYDPSAPAIGSVNPTPGWTEKTLDGEVYAEPLIYNGLVYAVTLNNTVYALDQASGAIMWSNHIGAPVSSGWQCGNVSPMGILGTPVIDVTGGRIYVAALLNSDHLYHVFGLNLANGAIVLGTAIPISIGTGFDWTIQQERGALALANGFVYVPFGGRLGDCGSYHGWVVGVPTSGSTSLNVYETPGAGSGIWAAGGVAVDDTTGNVFVATGNGVASGCSTVNQNDAVVRLSPTLTMTDYFMPQDWQANWCLNDQDLGSASPTLISSSLMFASGKWGTGFLLNPSSLGGVDGQLFPTPKPTTYAEADVCFGNHSDATFGGFAYAAPFVYVECEGRGLVALNVNTSTPSFGICSTTCGAPDWSAGSPNTFGPPIVAGGAVWVANNGGGLYAFDAASGVQLYHSAGFSVNRFVTPAEAGGQVFVPSLTVIKSFSFVPPPPPGAYTGVTPSRLMDTRNSGGPLGPGGTRNLTVAGVSGVPANATGVVMNITVTNTSAASWLAVYPGGSSQPLASNLNWVAGQTVPNLVEVPVGSGGAVTFYNSAGSTDVVADLQGYFAPPSGTAGGEVALTPARLTDHQPLGPGASLNLAVRGAGGVPASGVSAVILNVTASEVTSFSYLTVWPQCSSRPLASNLNMRPTQTVPNRVIVPVCSSGQISIYNAYGNANVTVDVDGYFTDSTATGKLFTPSNPLRLLDTRMGGTPIGPNSPLGLGVGGRTGVPASATAVILNVTVTNTTAPSFLTIYPCGFAQPLTSDLNWVAGQTIPNLSVATLGASGAVCFYNSAGSVDVVVDLFGYFN
jgi:outer membrane protein assembly factor BamB